MDLKDAVGDAEALSSSESGWTEYISSPIQDHYGEADGYGEVEDDDQEDGDSVASDASTGQLLNQSQHSSRSIVGEDREGSEDTRDGRTVKKQRGFKALKGREDDGKAPGGVSASKEVAAAATPSDNNLEVSRDLKC